MGSPKSTPTPPAPPDPLKTAQAQTGSNIQTAVANSLLGNANEVTPYGSVTYNQTGTTHVGGGLGGTGGGGGLGGFGGGLGAMTPGSALGSRLGSVLGGGGGFDPGYDIPQFTKTTTLSPTEQQKFDQQQQLGIGLNNLALGQTQRLSDTLGRPINADGLPSRVTSLGGLPALQGLNLDRVGDAGNIQRSVGPNDFSADRTAVENALFQRINPQLDRDRAALENNLVNQGFQRGTAAFDTAMDQYNRQVNDQRLAITSQGLGEQQGLFNMALQGGQFANTAQQQAYDQMLGRAGFNNAAQQSEVGMANANAQQGFGNAATAADFQNQQREASLQEQLSLRNQPINEVSALMNGGQVSLPNFAQYHGGTVAPTDYAGNVYNSAALANQQYGQQLQANAAQMGGLFGLGQAGILGAAKYFPSDRRLKRDIIDLGIRLMNGVKLYAYRYIGSPLERIGVMADEVAAVRPAAVASVNGYLAVNYRALV